MLDKEHIINETTKMFLQQGVRAIRMDDIAAHLGISKRTLYELFGDKERLITQCLEHYFRELDHHIVERSKRAKNVIEEFILMLGDWDSIMEVNIKLMEGVKKFYPQIYTALTQCEEEEDKRINLFKEKIVRGIEEGFFLPCINVDLALLVFADSLYGLMSSPEKFIKGNISPSEAFKYIMTYFFRGISTEKGIRLLDMYTNINQK